MIGAATCLLFFAAAEMSNSTVVNSLPGGTINSMPNIDYFGTGPKNFGEGITWYSEYDQSVFGYDNGYGFNSNGYWGQGLIMAGTNDRTSTMTFEFTTPITESAAL